jgi:16S rRNA (cytosine1402-N4)-methyltransferase
MFSSFDSVHKPVLLAEVLDWLSIEDDDIVVDCTFGNGGYSEAILHISKARVLAIDRDPSVIKRAAELQQQFGATRFKFAHDSFANLADILTANDYSHKVNKIMFDLGVSSMQLDQAERGFSFRYDAPLDMRMSQKGPDAAYFVNNKSQTEIADVLYKYGGERKSRAIARRILDARTVKPITTTGELAAIVRSVVGQKSGQIDGATRSFQAIRIWVNDELNQLEQALAAATSALAKNGRVAVVSFHSEEDRLIKDYFKKLAGVVSFSRHDITSNFAVQSEPAFKMLSKKAIKPSRDDIQYNPRARSAHLRVLQKLGAE